MRPAVPPVDVAVAAVVAVIVATAALARGEAASMAADVNGQMAFPDGDLEPVLLAVSAADR